MSSVQESPCPLCGAPPGCLSLDQVLVAKPLGSFSLGGAQMKVSAEKAPKLTCAACGLNVVGEYEDNQVIFPRRR